MLYDHRSAKKKLRPSWRGTFIVTGHGGTHSRSYTLRQIDGTPIPRTYHRDQLKLFKLREGRLVTGKELSLPTYQNIRLGRARVRLPSSTKTLTHQPSNSSPQQPSQASLRWPPPQLPTPAAGITASIAVAFYPIFGRSTNSIRLPAPASFLFPPHLCQISPTRQTFYRRPPHLLKDYPHHSN